VASRADIEAGKAFILLYVKNSKLLQGLAQSRASVFRFAADVVRILSPATWLKGIGGVMSSLGSRMAIAGTAAATAFLPAIKAASSVTEAIRGAANRFSAVFGSQTAAMLQWSSSLGSHLRRSATDVQASAAAYQVFFKGLRFGDSEATKLSKTMTALAADFGSFFSLPGKEADSRFLSALSGSEETLDEFGINLRQAAVEAELSAMGINKAWADVTEPEKVTARIAIIRKAMASQGAIGDAEKNRNSPANLWRDMLKSVRDITTAVGTAMLPTFVEIAKRVADVLAGVSKWVHDNQKLIASVGKAALTLAAFGAGLFALGKAFSFAGVLLAATLKFSVLAAAAVFLVPILFKVVSALRVLQIGFLALKTVLGLTVPLMLKFTLASAGLTLGIAAIGLAWANAQAQGISFGESVLDLTHRITSLSNAYTRLRDAEAFSKENSQIGGRLEAAARGGDVPEFDRSLKELKARRDEAAQKVREAEGRASAEGAMSYDPRSWFGIPSTAKEDLKAAQLELARLEGQIARLGQERPFVVATAWITAIPGAAKAVGKQFGTSFLEGFKSVVKTHLRVIDEFLPDLRRAQAEGIVDPREREIALKRLEWEERIKKARAERLPEDTLKRTRDQEIKNINDRYDREAEDRRKQMNQDTSDDIARLRIETTKKGLDKEMALLRLRQEKEMEAAKKSGADVGALATKHKLEQEALRMRSAKLPQTSTRGTFSAWEFARFGSTGTTAERQIQEQRRGNASLKRMETLTERQIDAIQRLRGLQFS
jgi:hypothetical protein